MKLTKNEKRDAIKLIYNRGMYEETGEREEHWTDDFIFENEWQSFRTKKDRLSQQIMQAAMQATMQENRVKDILEFCRNPRKREEIQSFIDISNRDYFRKKILTPLLEQGLLHPTIPDKLTSPKQRYYSGTPKEGTKSNSIEFDGIFKQADSKNPEEKQ
jgi:ATP-dependent DNA helicase RecG